MPIPPPSSFSELVEAGLDYAVNADVPVRVFILIDISDRTLAGYLVLLVATETAS